jgi:hypothetical protein
MDEKKIFSRSPAASGGTHAEAAAGTGGLQHYLAGGPSGGLEIGVEGIY